MAAGLATRSRTGHLVDLFRDRIMFPIHHLDGHPIAFLGRAAPSAAPDVPKYLNTPDTAIYHKGQTLYGAGEQADPIASGAAPVLVEGPIDVLAIALAFPDGSRVAVAACGTSLTANHAAAITTMPGAARHGITAALDNDDPGCKATYRAWQVLSAHPGIDLYAATLPDHTDPGDLISSPLDVDLLRVALTKDARPLAKAVIDIRLNAITARHPDLLRWPEGRITVARTLASLIASLPVDQVVALTGHIADCTHTGFDTVADAVLTHLGRSPPATTELAKLGGNRHPRSFLPPTTPTTGPAARSTAPTDRPSSRRRR